MKRIATIGVSLSIPSWIAGCGGGGGESYSSTAGGYSSGGLCTESCQFSGDEDCDDGGPGASYSLCSLGTDCTDCGMRYGGYSSSGYSSYGSGGGYSSYSSGGYRSCSYYYSQSCDSYGSLYYYSYRCSYYYSQRYC